MDTAEQKFERTRKKFQKNMRREQEKRRRTIFLQDDELPSTSKGRATRGRKQRTSEAQQHSLPKQYPAETNHSASMKANFFRMGTTTTPSAGKPVYQEPRRHDSVASQLRSDPRIGLEEEDEIIPPPPPYISIEQSSEKAASETSETISLLLDEECFAEDELPIDMEDPFIREFARTFCGANDSTMDIPPPRNPSPPSSFSSWDWEEENRRPPTPPRRKGYCTVDVEDRKFQYMGMQCYEKNLRVRILVPGTKSTPVPSISEQPFNPHNIYNELDPIQVTPPRQHISPDRAVPTTPGRGWLHHGNHNEETLTMGKEDLNSPRVTHIPWPQPNETPIPSPPPLSRSTIGELWLPQQPVAQVTTDSPAPSPPPLHLGLMGEAIAGEKLPVELQQEIARKQAQNRVRRTRFVRQIDGVKYRVTLSSKGDVRVTLLDITN